MAQPLAKSVTLVVPEYPSGVETLSCRNREVMGRSIQYTLRNGAICYVHLSGTLTEKWYPESKVGWYLKIRGAITIFDLKFILSFLKLYGRSRKSNVCDSGMSWNVLTKLGNGISCKDNCILQEAVVQALALRFVEKKLGPIECASCHRVTPYGSFPCEHEYISRKCEVERFRRKLRYLKVLSMLIF